MLAHWSTVKPAYRVIAGGRHQLVSSGDHRFLTERGWKHVTGAEQGPLQRPHLTVNNKLMGVGGVRGAAQGDCRLPARLPVRHDPRRRHHRALPRRTGGSLTSHQFRLALADQEALDRTADYLGRMRHRRTEFDFAEAVGHAPAMMAIRTGGASRSGRSNS